jgi:hypothetical protein
MWLVETIEGAFSARVVCWRTSVCSDVLGVAAPLARPSWKLPGDAAYVRITRQPALTWHLCQNLLLNEHNVSLFELMLFQNFRAKPFPSFTPRLPSAPLFLPTHFFFNVQKPTVTPIASCGRAH